MAETICPACCRNLICGQMTKVVSGCSYDRAKVPRTSGGKSNSCCLSSPEQAKRATGTRPRSTSGSRDSGSPLAMMVKAGFRHQIRFTNLAPARFADNAGWCYRVGITGRYGGGVEINNRLSNWIHPGTVLPVRYLVLAWPSMTISSFLTLRVSPLIVTIVYCVSSSW